MSGRKQISKAGIRGSEGNTEPGRAGDAYRLAGGIAHDLNTILTTIYGYCEMALESLEEESEARRNVLRIIEAVHRARELTGRLLDIDHMSAEEKQHLRVSEIISDSLRFVMPSAGDNISLSLQIKSPDLMVEAVPSQLFRVFMNITVNALRAMKEGGGILTVTLDYVSEVKGEEAADGRSLALIRFADTGEGMDQETASRIFEPYFTGDGNRAGTGLGLTVVQDIVTEMNGTLKVRSEKGKGTVIDLLIPAAVFGSHRGKS